MLKISNHFWLPTFISVCEHPLFVYRLLQCFDIYFVLIQILENSKCSWYADNVSQYLNNEGPVMQALIPIYVYIRQLSISTSHNTSTCAMLNLNPISAIADCALWVSPPAYSSTACVCHTQFGTLTHKAQASPGRPFAFSAHKTLHTS